MRRIGRIIVVGGLLVGLLSGCSSTAVPEKDPMPFAKAAIMQYQQKTLTALKAYTPAQMQATKDNPEKQKEFMYKCVVQPMEACGYSYDKTINNLCKAVLTQHLNFQDTETTLLFSDLLAFAKNTRDIELKCGYISQETKELLDKVSAVLPR